MFTKLRSLWLTFLQTLYLLWFARQPLPPSLRIYCIPPILTVTSPLPLKSPALSPLREHWDLLQKNGLQLSYFADSDCRLFIQTHFTPSVLQAYDSLVPPAYKADLFRYCKLFVHGGIYGDATQFYPQGLTSVLNANAELALCMDLPVCLKPCIQISFMAAAPRHPFFGSCIAEAVQRIQTQSYGGCTLDVTGPAMAADVVRRLGLHRFVTMKQCDDGIITRVGTSDALVVRHFAKFDQALSLNPANHYKVLWKGKEIFC